MNEDLYNKLALEAGGSHYPEVGGPTLRYFMKLIALECISVADEETSKRIKDLFQI